MYRREFMKRLLVLPTSGTTAAMTPLVDKVTSARTYFRSVASCSAYLGLVPPPTVLRPHGVSTFVIGRNEEEWAETSVRSIMGFADEVVLGDHASEDNTGEIFQDLADEYPSKVRLMRFSGELPFHEALNRMVAACRYAVILRFSSDCIARTSGPFSMGRFVERIRRTGWFRHFSIRLSPVALDGDLVHQFPGRRDPPEPVAYTYSPWIHYGIKERWESLHVPWFYEKLIYPEAYFFHMRSVKSPMRMLQKLYWNRWNEAQNKGSRVSLREYIAERAVAEWGGASVEEAARNYSLLEFGGCIPYSRELCGDYPDILLPALEDPPFRLIWKDGRLVDRIAKGRYRPQNWPAE